MPDDRSKKKASGSTPAAGKDSQPGKQRAVLRCQLVASAEVTEPSSGTRLSARVSELGLGGCYIETLNPFPDGTLVQLRILRDQGVFETEASGLFPRQLRDGPGLVARWLQSTVPAGRLAGRIVIQSGRLRRFDSPSGPGVLFPMMRLSN